MQVMSTIIVAATKLGGDPNARGLPGSSALQQLVGGLAFWGLLAALGGLIISAAAWALSAHGGNRPGWASAGLSSPQVRLC